MPPRLRTSSRPLCINVEPLTPLAFSPFGTVITSPLPATQSSMPKSSPLPPPLHPSDQPEPVIANQFTALRYSPISPLTNNYSNAPSHGLGSPLMSMFSCFPQKLSQDGKSEVKILERHPFTTQTFTPLGLSENDHETYFLVIVAPSLPDPLAVATPSDGKVQIQRPPDLLNLKAFTAHGEQAITYGVGTWHAPMMVLGKRRVDFVVTQFVSGVADEDCQEVMVDDGVVVQVLAQRTGPKL